ncbi:hypothetical protein NITHO_500028 [Nitrolancea hollandica Lb]|uniref:Uncharacterized protein n=1 Tax=Nitrolancea hollandica Lb TaxID=1129897 RepID=I4ELD1_9BACT|nr:hypothetical protein NITHO_500028 [Nitrolancea hollandica Lb]
MIGGDPAGGYLCAQAPQTPLWPAFRTHLPVPEIVEQTCEPPALQERTG